MTKRRLVVASHNRAKAREIADILREEDLDFEVLSLADFPEVALPEEAGDTFARNAADKACFVTRALGLPAVADDSGLEVDALKGEPGVRSARFAGPDAGDEDRYRKLLGLLLDVPEAERTARFRCAAAYTDPDGQTILAEGACEGRIAFSPAGSGGFGYDPVFLPAGDTRTMAQLAPAEKRAISHRGRAFRELARLMRAAVEGR